MPVFGPLYRRELGGKGAGLGRQISQSADLVHRLALQRKLEGHNGCVNTISFNDQGDVLLSGSDDQNLTIWDWQTGAPRLTFRPGHHGNIFQGRFLPNTNDHTIVSCAADGQVRVSQLADDGLWACRLVGSHGGRAHKLATLPGSPSAFFSCGEDGEVKFFDLREANHRPVTCMTVFKGSGAVELNAIHVSPLRPWQFAVGGADEWVRLYDHRAMSTGRAAAAAASDGAGGAEPTGAAVDATIQGASSHAPRASRIRQQQQQPPPPQDVYRTRSGRRVMAVPTVRLQPALELCPGHLRGQLGSRGVKHITCVVFSQAGEVLATYNDEDIYLFQPSALPSAASTPIRTTSGSEAQDGAAMQQHLAESNGQEQADVDVSHDSGLRGNSSGHQHDHVERGDQGSGLSAGSAPAPCHEDFVTGHYRGHRNNRTVKGVSFLGVDDEWVMSGSDCGHVFVWSKADGKLHQMLKGDAQVVNCLEPHPTLPLTFATSGIEDTVKIWAPTAEAPHPPGQEAEAVMSKNKQRQQSDSRAMVISPEVLFAMLQHRQASRRRREAEAAGGQQQQGEGADDDGSEEVDMDEVMAQWQGEDDDWDDEGEGEEEEGEDGAAGEDRRRGRTLEECIIS